MGAGRKTQTLIVDSRTSVFENCAHSFRNLHKNDLGGVIFGCKHSTMPECLSKQLFGLPSAHILYVRNIQPGLPIFHFNYSDRKLHGIYESASHGKMNLDAYAWTDGGAERTPFPAQIRIRVRAQGQPLTENQFKKIIEDNYYTPQHFWFELDHAQTRCLIAQFKPYDPTAVPSLIPLSQNNHFPLLPAAKWKAKKELKDPISSVNENKFAALLLDNVDNDCGVSSKASSNALEDGDLKEPVSDWEELADGDLEGKSSAIGTSFNEFNENLDHEQVDVQDYKNVLLKLKRFSDNCQLNSSSSTFVGDSTSSCVHKKLTSQNEQFLGISCTLDDKHRDKAAPNICLEIVQEDEQALNVSCALSTEGDDQIALNCYDEHSNMISSKLLKDDGSLNKEGKIPTSAVHSPGNVELLEYIREMMDRIAKLEQQQVESDRETRHLRDLLKNSGREIQLLNSRVKELESKIGPSVLLDHHIGEFVEHYLGSEDVIYLIGGYDGSAWLSALDSFSPSLDLLKPLKSMSSARSYASAVALNEVLYVLGGGDGSSWYDTVECYDNKHDVWNSCPSMIRAKGSLAGATVNGKIYAIGGGDGLDCFADVEMFDPALGRWISWQSMLHKRFAPAAAELNGVLYAVGGYNGQDYLKSAERLDPREFSWTQIPDMKSRRGCHSLAVLNQKLYAMGGYDGDSMVSSLEIYDPRADAWMPGEPMNNIRGYAATVVLGNSLYTMGGIKDSENIVETIECYIEGDGWSNTRLRAVGKRSFFSAIVL